jgi:dipeptidyl aminopeptidase/acylaminoacyl peptidase
MRDAPAGGVISELRFARDAGVLAFTFTDPATPRGAYTYDLAGDRLVAWTRAETSALAAVSPRASRPTSFDGTAIPLLAYLPSRVKPPVVIDLHGGPEDQWQRRWAGFAQFLVARGFAVVQPNVRGSTGYGAAFAALDDGRHREDAVRDVGAVLDWIVATDTFDVRRVYVMGTSYGGYLALAALARYPDRLRGGIDLVGIADFVTFLEGTRGDRRDQRRAEYGDERDPETRAFLARISPLAYARGIRAPVVVAHGRRDPRVPPADADRLVAALRAAGTIVWYVVADDEGHGFAKPENRGVFEVLVTQFLEATAR